MEKRNRNILILSIIALVALFTGLSFAYFSARITGLESASTLSLTAGRMGIVYSEDDARVEVSNIYPRSEAWLTKQITLTGYNTTDLAMKYDLGINVTTNTFTNGYLTYDLRLVSGTNGTPIATKNAASLNGTGKIKLGSGTFTNANGDSHIYELKIYFKDNGLDQNEAQGAVFNGKIYVEEHQNLNCIADDTNSSNLFAVSSFDVNVENCKSYYSWLPSEGLTESDIGRFCNKETVTNEYNNEYSLSNDIIWNSQDLITNNVISNVVYGNQLLHNGTYVNGQYTYTYISKRFDEQLGDYIALPENEQGWNIRFEPENIDDPLTTEMCSYVNGKPIISMAYMFGSYDVTNIDFSTLDASHVTDTSYMFIGNSSSILDLSSFDTSHVTNMAGMFQCYNSESLTIVGLNTSNVTNMQSMFSLNTFCSVTTPLDYLDISSFNTLNVTNMQSMFASSLLKKVYVSSGWNTANVTMGTSMFGYNGRGAIVGGAGTTYDNNHQDVSYAHIDGGVSNPGYLTYVADKN